jgi:hypothetical protein
MPPPTPTTAPAANPAGQPAAKVAPAAGVPTAVYGVRIAGFWNSTHRLSTAEGPLGVLTVQRNRWGMVVGGRYSPAKGEVLVIRRDPGLLRSQYSMWTEGKEWLGSSLRWHISPPRGGAPHGKPSPAPPAPARLPPRMDPSGPQDGRNGPDSRRPPVPGGSDRGLSEGGDGAPGVRLLHCSADSLGVPVARPECRRRDRPWGWRRPWPHLSGPFIRCKGPGKKPAPAASVLPSDRPLEPLGHPSLTRSRSAGLSAAGLARTLTSRTT